MLLAARAVGATVLWIVLGLAGIAPPDLATPASRIPGADARRRFQA
jgi:hypothetical protein